jgi:hypothetical protein
VERRSLRLHTMARERIPGDGGVESWLTVMMSRQLDGQRELGSTLVVVRERTIDLVDSGAARAAGFELSALLAGLTTTTTPAGGAVEAVGLLGRVNVRSRDAELPAAVAFLEWADCRWWMWEALLTPDARGLREETARERSAVDGDALPTGLGRFWSHARRSGVRMELGLVEPVVH